MKNVTYIQRNGVSVNALLERTPNFVRRASRPKAGEKVAAIVPVWKVSGGYKTLADLTVVVEEASSRKAYRYGWAPAEKANALVKAFVLAVLKIKQERSAAAQKRAAQRRKPSLRLV